MTEPQRADAMDVDSSAAQPVADQKENMPGSFGGTNCANGTADKMDVDTDEAPVPPPHKSAPASPVEKPAPTPEEAEAFKNAGNTHYKAKEYGKAIVEYTKGKLWITACAQSYV